MDLFNMKLMYIFNRLEGKFNKLKIPQCSLPSSILDGRFCFWVVTVCENPSKDSFSSLLHTAPHTGLT